LLNLKKKIFLKTKWLWQKYLFPISWNDKCDYKANQPSILFQGYKKCCSPEISGDGSSWIVKFSILSQI
jgi:hypothetical protein